MEFHRMKTSVFSLPSASSNWGTLKDVISLMRAEELHRVMFKGHPPLPFWSSAFTPLVTKEDDEDIGHLSATEAKGAWEWRLERAGWCGN